MVLVEVRFSQAEDLERKGGGGRLEERTLKKRKRRRGE